MRVLVCGGRDYLDRDHIWNTLTDLDAQRGPFKVIIHGCATGADNEAMLWALANERWHTPFQADWGKYGRAAGPIRNRRMIDEGKPDLVIAFPGGRGTVDMVRQARGAGVQVIEVKQKTGGK